MRELKPITGHPGLVKDPVTGMIININTDKISKNKALREQRKQEREEIENLKSDVNDIKMMLKKLLESGTNASES